LRPTHVSVAPHGKAGGLVVGSSDVGRRWNGVLGHRVRRTGFMLFDSFLLIFQGLSFTPIIATPGRLA
jgi:hypothetical protein